MSCLLITLIKCLMLEFTCMPVVMCLVGNCRSQLLQLCSQAWLTASLPSSPSFSTSSSPPLSLSNPFSLDHPFFSRHYFRIRSSFCHFPHFLSLIITGVAIADSLTKDHFRFEEDWERLQQHGQLWSTLNICWSSKTFKICFLKSLFISRRLRINIVCLSPVFLDFLTPVSFWD